MDIPNMKYRETDLDRFLKFADNINSKKYKVIKEDWDNMCGIIISRESDLKIEHTVFNFYEDGEFRRIFQEVKLIDKIPQKSLLRKLGLK